MDRHIGARRKLTDAERARWLDNSKLQEVMKDGFKTLQAANKSHISLEPIRTQYESEANSILEVLESADLLPYWITSVINMDYIDPQLDASEENVWNMWDFYTDSSNKEILTLIDEDEVAKEAEIVMFICKLAENHGGQIKDNVVNGIQELKKEAFYDGARWMKGQLETAFHQITSSALK
jgi:hypothetical protein